ncbi:helix-turn-helix domain-containing protein [Streptomyces sp. M10(2022)]
MHPNTLRYRLRRVRERFGVDTDDPDTRLLLMIAVRLVGLGQMYALVACLGVCGRVDGV